MFCIKNVLLDDQKIKAKIQENKAKPKEEQMECENAGDNGASSRATKLREQQNLKKKRKKEIMFLIFHIELNRPSIGRFFRLYNFKSITLRFKL